MCGPITNSPAIASPPTKAGGPVGSTPSSPPSTTVSSPPAVGGGYASSLAGLCDALDALRALLAGWSGSSATPPNNAMPTTPDGIQTVGARRGG